jgi:uroporphyrinogen-III synthase
MQRLLAQGALPTLHPALQLVAPQHPEALSARLAEAGRYDFLIFISPSAVRFGLAALRHALPSLDLAGLKTAAVGAGTAAALHAAGLVHVLAPQQGADSEHLLALPELADLAGQRVLILRGEGGRELLAETLRGRGAEVEYAECYRRIAPRSDPAALQLALLQQRIQAITLFSSETLDNLLRMLDPPSLAVAHRLPLFVPHPRIAQHAGAQGFAKVVTTAPGEDGMLAGLVEYFAHV